MNNNYDQTKHKIRTTWEFINTENNRYDALLKEKINAIPIYYVKNQNIYTLEEKHIFLAPNGSSILSYTKLLTLKNFPIHRLSYLRATIILSTEPAYESSDIISSQDFDELSTSNKVNKIYLTQSNNINYFSLRNDDDTEDEYYIYLGLSNSLKKRITQFSDSWLPLYGKIILSVIDYGDYNELRPNKT